MLRVTVGRRVRMIEDKLSSPRQVCTYDSKLSSAHLVRTIECKPGSVLRSEMPALPPTSLSWWGLFATGVQPDNCGQVSSGTPPVSEQ